MTKGAVVNLMSSRVGAITPPRRQLTWEESQKKAQHVKQGK